MKRFCVLFVVALFTLPGCRSEQRSSDSRAVPAPVDDDVATLPKDPPSPYPEYCVYYPEIKATPPNYKRLETPRVAILGVRASVQGGWTTDQKVPLKDGHTTNTVKLSRCLDEKHFRNGDTLSISPAAGGLALSLNRAGISYGPYPLSIGGTDGTGNDPPVLWYSTTDVHAGYRYHVYMANAINGLNHQKQRYWIEAFRVGGTGSNGAAIPAENAECLDEQPGPNMKNVRKKKANYCPYGLGPQENGIGVGDEPK